MKILIVTDAWRPQINGVVRTLEALERSLIAMGHHVLVISPDPSRVASFPLPGYKEITLEFFAGRRSLRTLEHFQPDLIHLATEGPLGWSMRRLCRQRRLTFTTAYHSCFPEYLAARVPFLLQKVVRILAYAFLRRFHAASKAVLVATGSIRNELHERGFQRLVHWPRGIDTEIFHPGDRHFPLFEGLPRPVLLYVGRIAREKNLPAFLEVKTEGSKVIIGEGPDLPALKNQYPDGVFLGSLEGSALARAYAAADLFVFPSKTDTFGLVLLEACASGLRLAAYPAPGPVDLFSGQETQSFAVLDLDLQTAVDKALALPEDPTVPRHFAEKFSWQASAESFLHHSTG